MRLFKGYGWRILIGLVMAVVLCCAVAIWMPYQKELRIAASIERVGGEVTRRYEGPVWLEATVGRLAVFDRIYGVEFYGDETPVEVLRELRSLPHLERLDFTHSEIMDDDLEQLRGLANLRLLNLRYTKTSDLGLPYLSDLRSLTFLQLEHTAITDAGLDHLKGMSQLKELWVANTQTTEAGRAKVQEALPHCKIVATR